MDSESGDKNRYFIEAAAKTLDVLESFTDNTEQLSITEIAKRAKLPYTSAFRFVHTLAKRGYVTRAPGPRERDYELGMPLSEKSHLPAR
jgi:IclR family transcriptional regulator, pca regulon regulatory protein